MPDLWFVLGLAIGMVLMGFCAIGSFDRGADSVRRHTWNVELAARRRAFVVSRSARAVATAFVPELLSAPVAAAALERAPRQAPAGERWTRVHREQGDALTSVAL